MREQRLIAQHRGTPTIADRAPRTHGMGLRLCGTCPPLLNEHADERLAAALAVSREWQTRAMKPGKAMKAFVAAHAAAREYADPVSAAVARSVGQAAGTAHFAEDAIGAALYALKAAKLNGASVERERDWQDEQISHALSDLVREVRARKEIAFKLG